MDNNQPYHTKTPYPRTIGVQATAFCPRHAFPDRENLSYGIIVVFSPRSPVSLSIHSSFFIHHSSLSYTFSAKERDPETGLSYFGSRYYSSDLSIWLSVDPMSDKYPSLSPYVYCANNPVKLVDPDGEEIVIEWRGSQYRYEKDGTLTHLKGSVLDERQQKRFINKAKNSLDQINKTTEGNRMISDLQSSETQYTIKSGASGYEKKEQNTITWSANGTKLPVQGNPLGESNGTCDLAHELSHAFDDNNNWRDFTVVGRDCTSTDKIEKNEWVACYRENLVRNELGFGYRTHYVIKRGADGQFLGGTGPSLLNEDKTGPFLPFSIESYEKK